MVYWKGLCLLVVVLLGYRLYDRFLHTDLRITFLDVGQGDASLLELPGGYRLLVDAGGRAGMSDEVTRHLLPVLARKAILTVDAAILSHPDEDHAFGFVGLFTQLKVRGFWVNGYLSEKRLERELKQLAALEQIPVTFHRQTVTKRLGETAVTLYPLQGNAKGANDKALVLEVSYAGCRVLFTGDIEEAGEKELIQKIDHPIDLLKVPHHGSRTSSSFPLLQQLRPRWAVASMARQNRYGHPHLEVSRRYHDNQIQFFRTDIHGSVTFAISRRGTVRCHSSAGLCGESRCGSESRKRHPAPFAQK